MKLRTLGAALLLVILGLAIGCDPSPRFLPAFLRGDAKSIVLASYNIHIGKGTDGVLDLERIATLLADARVDVAGLQEVDRLTRRCGNVDQIAELERLTGMKGVFGKSIDLQGGEYGVAILTTGEVLEQQHRLHPVGKESERRSFLLVKIRARNGAVFWVVNTHLGLVAEDRRAQAKAIRDAVADLTEPVVLLGDFNETAGEGQGGIIVTLGEEYLDAWLAAPDKTFVRPQGETAEGPSEYAGETFPSEMPAKRIDFIWLRPKSGWEVRRAWVTESTASDHLPVFAEVQLKEQE